MTDPPPWRGSLQIVEGAIGLVQRHPNPRRGVEERGLSGKRIPEIFQQRDRLLGPFLAGAVLLRFLSRVIQGLEQRLAGPNALGIGLHPTA